MAKLKFLLNGQWVEIGTKGDNGKSSYDIAVENGYEGTEEQWISNIIDAISEAPEILEDVEDIKDISTEILNKVNGAQVDQNSLKPLVFGIDGDKVYISDTAEQDTTYIGRDANGLYVTK